MSIVTKTGDRGKTSLYGGKRVPKDDARIEVCGAIDEVSSFLSLAKNISQDSRTKRVVNSVQKELIVFGAEIAAIPDAGSRLKKRLGKDSVCIIEKEIKDLENKHELKLKYFCLPGANTASSALDIARAITRRAERRCVTLSRKGMIKNRNITTYLNRLSDLLYLLARFNEKR